MTANEYQDLARRTLVDRPGFSLEDNETMLVWNAIGLAGEAGEVADSIKKMIFHQHGLDRETLRGELGDVLWYVAALASNLGYNLDEVMAANVDKLKARYPEGYSPEASLNRKV